MRFTAHILTVALCRWSLLPSPPPFVKHDVLQHVSPRIMTYLLADDGYG